MTLFALVLSQALINHSLVEVYGLEKGIVVASIVKQKFPFTEY